MKIKKIEIKNFKKFQNLEINFQDLDCLVGSNNSGKSTLLQALALFDFCLHQCLTKTNGKPISIKNRSISEDDFVILPVAKGTDLWYDRMWQAGSKHILIEFIATFDNDKTVKTSLDFNFNRFSLKTETDETEEWLEELRKFKISYLPVFSTFQTKEEKRTHIAVRNELGRGNVNIVIRNLLLSLKEEKREKDLVDILQRAFPNIKKLSIEFDEANMEFISVIYKEEGIKKEFDIFSAGSGFQQFIYLFGFMLLEKPDIILLDEPDVHLHGQLQKSLLFELQTLAGLGSQVFFATHSRDLITAVLPENIILLHDGSAERLHLDYQVFNTLEQMGSMENTQLITLQEFKRVLVVENKSDWDILQHFGRFVIGDKKMQQVAKRLAVCYAYGNPVKQDMPKFRKSLQTMFTQSGDTVKMMVIADNDYFPDVQKLIEEQDKKELNADKKTENHIQWHIWERNEMENYLLVKKALLKLVKPKTNKQVTIEEVTFFDKFESILQVQKDDIEGRFMKGFEDYSRIFKMNWDSTYCLKEAKKRLAKDWQQPTYWVDAKKTLSGLQKWLQDEGYASFSDKAILESIVSDDLPQEVHILLKKIATFVGL